GLAKRLAGTACFMTFAASSSEWPDLADLFLIISVNLSVLVAPGRTLLTVIPNWPSSLAKVLLQLATAPLMVLLTPSPSNGCFTEVEMILMMRPKLSDFIKGTSVCANT